MDWTLGKMERRFAELIWENAPIPSGAVRTGAGVEKIYHLYDAPPSLPAGHL